jgi:hypothetical protein
LLNSKQSSGTDESGADGGKASRFTDLGCILDKDLVSSQWKSLLTGNLKTIRFEGDFAYVENTVPEEARRRRDFSLSELKKTGDTSYEGSHRTRRSCSYFSIWSPNDPQYNVCQFEEPIEFTSVTAGRIEGRIVQPPSDAKFDCKKCTFSKKPIWTKFTWIPQ